MELIRVKVTVPALPEPLRVAINSCPLLKKTPEKQVEWLNKTAAKRGLEASYELATEDEYWEYRAKLKAEAAARATPQQA